MCLEFPQCFLEEMVWNKYCFFAKGLEAAVF